MTEEYYKEQHELLLKSGMFWEFYPELTGRYSLDQDAWKIIVDQINNKDNDKNI